MVSMRKKTIGEVLRLARINQGLSLEELQRPRIDVMGRISGLIRDMMPTAIGWLDKAVEMVAELDEPLEDNYVKKHIHDDVDWLAEQREDTLLGFGFGKVVGG